MSTPRSREEIRETVLRVLHQIAPEIDPAEVDPDVAWQDQLDIDSVDLLNVVVGLHEALGVDIPEADYPKLSTLGKTVDYLATKSS